MLPKEKIDRINFLARKKKCEPLTEAELAEQAALRTEYLEKFRESFKAQLDCIEVVDEAVEEIEEIAVIGESVEN